jgi:sec-independent protein translocase protein TatC
MAQLIDSAPGSASELQPVSGPVLDDEKVMSLTEHLTELRRRLIISLAAITVGSVIGWFAAPRAIEILRAPITPYYNRPLVFTQPGAAFFLELKLALMIGVALAAPIVLYQLWAFVSPGLTAQERRVARPWVPLAVLFLILGIGVAYLILPLAMGFLLSFQVPGSIEPLLTLESYFGFVTGLFLAFGLVMQFPIALVLLSKTGLVSVERLKRNRRYVALAIIVFAVVATPGGDPFSPTIMALVMYPLYELSIYLIGRSERPTTTQTSS